MDLMLLRVFQQQVLLECQFFILGSLELNASLVVGGDFRTWYAIEIMLNSAANISKALWGQAGRKSEQRKELRDSIGIADDSPLRAVVMRNHFQHIDERLDDWWSTSKGHNMVDQNFGDVTRAISGIEEKDIFRNFDPQTASVIFWGEKFNLQTLAAEINRILPRLKLEASKPHWEPRPAKQPEAASRRSPDEAKAE